MEKKCAFVPKQKHTITITNKYDPNVDYYRERERQYGNKNKHTTHKNKDYSYIFENIIQESDFIRNISQFPYM